jgi:hypothetical protein
MMSNELSRYFWRGTSPGRAAVCGVRVGWRGGRTFEYYLDAGDMKERLSGNSREMTRRRETDMTRGTRSNGGITVTPPCKSKQEARKVVRLRELGWAPPCRS